MERFAYSIATTQAIMKDRTVVSDSLLCAETREQILSALRLILGAGAPVRLASLSRG